MIGLCNLKYLFAEICIFLIIHFLIVQQNFPKLNYIVLLS